jgi:hypothetical protein
MQKFNDNEENAIEVRAGFQQRSGIKGNGFRKFNQFLTQVYENDILVKQFTDSEIDEDMYLPIQDKLQELAQAGAGIHEVVSAIQTIGRIQTEYNLLAETIVGQKDMIQDLRSESYLGSYGF